MALRRSKESFLFLYLFGLFDLSLRFWKCRGLCLFQSEKKMGLRLDVAVFKLDKLKSPINKLNAC